ncbi:MAG: hypothetical protein LC135_10565 [Phycisphaerae bacterium]|nr:hypothetical protein [Phycisphaerae bacterium]MCZ2400291.1 hypothetical protein [Phycisphaerae bacterium]NUQ49255.1 hypothetical protein [Phycisphaerae bacterium]
MQPAEITDAGRHKVDRAAALKLARAVSTLIVARGKRIQRFDIRGSDPPDDELAAVLLGPTGNLRAPAIRRGRVLLVGFSPEAYASLL